MYGFLVESSLEVKFEGCVIKFGVCLRVGSFVWVVYYVLPCVTVLPFFVLGLVGWFGVICVYVCGFFNFLSFLVVWYGLHGESVLNRLI